MGSDSNRGSGLIFYGYISLIYGYTAEIVKSDTFV